jgi:hypothetical protein
MELQEVEITIDKSGKVIVHVRGVKGQACLELTSELEKILGGEVEVREFTPEMMDENANGLYNQIENRTTKK